MIRLTLSRSVAHNVTKEKTTKDDRSSNRGRSKSRHRGKSRPHSGQAVCWNCQKPGHFKKDCRNPKKEENNSANTVAVDTLEDALVLAVHTQADDWVLDFGASFHTPHIKKS